MTMVESTQTLLPKSMTFFTVCSSYSDKLGACKNIRWVREEIRKLNPGNIGNVFVELCPKPKLS
jgi:hypothetical protein